MHSPCNLQGETCPDWAQRLLKLLGGVVAVCLAMPLSEAAMAAGQASITTTVPSGNNVMPLTVKALTKSFDVEDDGQHKIKTITAFNRMAVSIRICVHGTQHCTIVDNVMVDTGSTGLRLQDGVLAGLPLPTEVLNGESVAECFGFVSSNIWGDVKTADVYFGRLLLTNLAVQVSNKKLVRPSDGTCPEFKSPVASNGTLGIGWGTREIGTYYGCVSGGDCKRLPSPVPADIRLVNPVTALPQDNNGEIFQLPPADAAVTDSVKGWLIFGVNTEANNQISQPADSLIKLNQSGNFTTQYVNPTTQVVSTYSRTYIDSGTMTSGFYQNSLGTCKDRSSYYCTSQKVPLLPIQVVPSDGGPSFTTELRISTQPGPAAGNLTKVYDDLIYKHQASDTSSFVFGLPFFLEKRLALVQSGKIPNHMTIPGPFYAYRSYEGPDR